MKPTHFLASVLALSTVTSAWPWPPSLGDIKTLAQENGLYQKRQNDGGGNTGGDNNNNNNQGGGGDNNSASSAQPTVSGSGSGSAAQSGSTQASNTDNTASNTDSASGSNTDSASGSGSSNTDSNASSTASATSSQYTDSIPLGAQPGGVNMIQPNTQSTATQYYKVDQTITWQWNYTSLSRNPSAIDIIATVSGGVSSAAPSPFTLATNYSFAATQSFVWDTGKYVNETSALPVGTYTLQIFDAAASGGVSATASAGYLAPYNQFRFGMYTGQPSTPLASAFMCSTCNSASARMEGKIIWMVVGTASMTVASFFWFAGGWGVL